MGLFGRKKGGAGGRPDPQLELLSTGEADRLRGIVRTVLAENGFEADILGDHARTADGRVLGLDNLMRKARTASPGEWDALVREHFAPLLAPTNDEPGDDELRERIVARLVDITSSDPRVSFGYALEWQPGVAEVLAVDYPDRVSMLGDGSVARMTPLGPWYDRARLNLYRALLDAEVTIETIEHEGHSIGCALSDSVYTASGALFLPDLLTRWQPGIDLRGGVLFGIPYRNQLPFVACSDHALALGALILLPRFCMSGFSDGVGPVSPHVYYWRDGHITQITSVVDGALTVTPTPELIAILNNES